MSASESKPGIQTQTGLSHPRRFSVIVYPGTNCELDALDVLNRVLGQNARAIWHREKSLQRPHAVILPGGFAHGDYLRPGAIARFSPATQTLEGFVAKGNPVLAICNGMQVAAEAGFIPGALLPNTSLQFRCQWTHIRVERTDTLFTNQCSKGQVLKIPIAHHDGRFYADPETLAGIYSNGQVIFRYCDEKGSPTVESNPNGSTDNIAGVINKVGNVLALMPHPERASEQVLGSEDGKLIFQSLVTALNQRNWRKKYLKP